MAGRHRQEKTSSRLSNGYVKHPLSKENQSDLTRCLWKRRPHVALDWDAAEQKVVSKQNQVGISWRHLSSHSYWGNHIRLALADVVQVPPELFQLKDLKEVLTLEAWNECLSASEIQFLRKLLPKDAEPEGVVRSILSGDNFHFGNPLTTWGGLICKGGFHPDSVQKTDLEFKNIRKEYYVELQRYHHKMLETLGALKELWVSCKSTKEELSFKHSSCTKREMLQNGVANAVSNHSLSEKHKKHFLPVEKGATVCKLDNGSFNEEAIIRQRSKRRKIGSLQDALERIDSLPTKQSRRVKPAVHNSVNKDGCTEIMYTLKVSPKQYADIVNQKRVGDELLLKSLSVILGDSQKIEVHRINGCNKEDTLKICQFWSTLVEKDMPAAHADFLERKAYRERLAKCAAEQCMQQLPRFLSKEVKKGFKSSSNTSLPAVFTGQELPLKDSIGADTAKQKQLSASESSITCMEGQMGMQATVDSCISSVDMRSPLNQQFLASKEDSHFDRLDSSSLLDGDPAVLASMQAENSLRVWKDMGGEGLPHAQGREHFQESDPQKDTVVASESDVSDDEVSAIKNIWSNDDLDTQELHSQNGTAVKENSYLSRKGSNIWDPHSKPASEVVNVASGSAESEEVEQRIGFQTGILCTGLDTHVSDSQVPSFQNHDQLYNFSQHQSFFRHQDHLSNGPLFYSSHALNMGSSTDKQESEKHEHRQGKHYKTNREYDTLIPGKANKFPQVGELNVDQDKIDHGQTQQMLLPKFFGHCSRSDAFISVDSRSNHERLSPPVPTLQSGGLCKPSEAMGYLSLASQSVDECTQENHEALTELRLLSDDRKTKQVGHLQQSEAGSSRTQSNLGEHHLEHLMLRHDRQQVQLFPFLQQVHQNQELQHSRLDLHSMCTISPSLSGWSASQQISSSRTSMNTSQFGLKAQWSVGDGAAQASWGHIEVPAPFFPKEKNEDRRFPNTLSPWDQLSQNPYIVDNGPSKHGQLLGITKPFSGGSYSITDGCQQGFQGQEDWTHLQPLSLNHHAYNWTGDKSRTGVHPWMSLSPGSHNSQQISQYEQQVLQDRPLAKTNSHLGTSWECFL